MRICFIAPANNYHTKKWCKYFVQRRHEVHVISFEDAIIDSVRVHAIDNNVNIKGGDFGKLLYLLMAKRIRNLVEEIKPDVVSVHYASSYGSAVAISGVKGYALSVWGSDVYEFPKKSIFHRALLRYSLKSAKYLLSTSEAMAREAGKYTKKEILVTPFGVDMQLFSPQKRSREENDHEFIVGTVKALNPKYGIDNLIKAVAIVRKNNPIMPIKLRISGTGVSEKKLKDLAEKVGISDITTWLGFVSQEKAAIEWANMDVAVVCSREESFGVSAVEAQACCVPVIISGIPGLREATDPGHSSVIVAVDDEEALAQAIEELYRKDDVRRLMGAAGLKYVRENYEWKKCFEKIENIFESIKENNT